MLLNIILIIIISIIVCRMNLYRYEKVIEKVNNDFLERLEDEVLKALEKFK